MTATVLIADALDRSAVGRLSQVGISFDIQPSLSGNALADALTDARVLVVRSTRVTGEILAKAPRLELIVRAGSGVNTIDVAAASGLGMLVANCPGQNSVAVAELCLGLLLSADRRIPDAVADLRRGRWDKKGYGRAEGVLGRTLGLYGFGAIARAVAARARGFGLRIQAFSPSLSDDTAEAAGVVRSPSPAALFESSDYVSLHLPLSDATRGLVDAALLDRMPKGALLINTARAEIVDEAEVARRVEAGDLRYATDVFADEPAESVGTIESTLLSLEGVYGTHHVGASTAQAQRAVANHAVDLVLQYLRAGTLRSAVNLDDSRATGMLVVRHLDRVGALAGVLELLRASDINVQSVTNRSLAGGVAASVQMALASPPDGALLQKLRGLPHVLGAEFTGKRAD